jgi:cation diffusion facilitator CzcD-associated flavoprotein CzcO
MGDLGPLPYTILPQWHSEPRKLRVVCVGAGASGLLAVYKFKRQSDKYEITIYDK